MVRYFQTKFSLPTFVRRVDKLTHDQRGAIQSAGFGNLLHIHNQLLNKHLLVELMERWDSKKQAFVLPPGEITISTLDVALILGLCGTGIPVLLDGDVPFSKLEKDFGASTTNRKIPVSFIEKRLELLTGQANEDFVRAFLMFVFGAFLFPNTSGKVDSRYLCLLEDLDKVADFAWGAAVLEDLFHWLSRWKEEGVVCIGGCLILLLVWSYEHIDVGRPNMVDHHLQFPRACRWESTRFYDTSGLYTAKFDALKEKQITWKLQLTEAESEVDLIKELLVAINYQKEVSVSKCSASAMELISSLQTLNFESRAEIWNPAENGDENIREQFKASLVPASGPVGSSKDTVTASSFIRKIKKEQMEPPSSFAHCLVDSNLKNEVCGEAANQRVLEKEITHLREENTALMEEVEKLRQENDSLKNQQMMAETLQEENEKLRKGVEEYTALREEVEKLRQEYATQTNQQMMAETLQEENEKLRKEVEGLKRENESSLWARGVLARLERILEGNEDRITYTS